VRAVDVVGAGEHAPVVLPVTASVAAGDAPGDHAPGTATRIMTGAPVPRGADAVVPFEWTDAGSPVAVRRGAGPAQHIRRAAEEVSAGAVALEAGARLGPVQLAWLVACGVGTVTVRARPRVAVVSTGSELGPAEDPVGVPDSNAVALTAATEAMGCEVRRYGPVGDDVEAVRAVVAAAACHADLVVTTGGISAGDLDVVKAALRDEAGFWFGHVAVKPGRPQGCGVLEADGRRVPVVCLPGTPVAAYSSFLAFVAPALRVLAGGGPRHRTALLAVGVTASDRTVLLPGRYDEVGRVAPLRGHVGHSQRLLLRADALLVVPPFGRVIPAGEPIEVLALRPEEDR
jgi:molybdopterin molybdotransferase